MKPLVLLCLSCLLSPCLLGGTQLTADQINKLVYADPVKKADFVFEGVVEIDWIRKPGPNPALAVMDETGAVLLHVSTTITNASFHAGDRLRVEGRTDYASSLSGSANACAIRPFGRGEKPEPTNVTAADFFSGRYNNRLVRLEGFVRSIGIDEIDPDFMFLELRADGESIFIGIPANDRTLRERDNLDGARIAVAGLCLPRVMTLRKHIGTMLMPRNGLDDFKILEPAPTDPLGLPDIRQLKRLRPSDIARHGWHAAQGRILCTWNNGQEVLLRLFDDNPQRLSFSCTSTPTNGTSVAVCGLPEPNLFTVDLVRARWTPIPGESSRLTLPEPVSSASLFTDNAGRDQMHPEFHGKLVRITGFVSKFKLGENADREFLLECEGRPVPVIFGDACRQLALPSAGALVEATGYCIVESERWQPNRRFQRITNVSLVLPDDDKLTVLAQPPWWTPAKFAVVAIALLGLLLVILVWNRSLHVLVVRRSHQLFREKAAHYGESLRVDERTKLAVELHDSLSQSLTGVCLELEAAGRLAGEGTSALRAHLTTATLALRSCHAELRNCLWDLRNLSLEEKDMATAIRRTLAPHVKDKNLTVRFPIARNRFSDNTMHAILRIVRELSVNAIRHGQATGIAVAGAIDANRLLISVRDNGCGFDPVSAPGVREGHFGLGGIRERLALLHGTLTIDSKPGTGTRAVISIPLPTETESKS